MVFTSFCPTDHVDYMLTVISLTFTGTTISFDSSRPMKFSPEMREFQEVLRRVLTDLPQSGAKHVWKLELIWSTVLELKLGLKITEYKTEIRH